MYGTVILVKHGTDAGGPVRFWIENQGTKGTKGGVDFFPDDRGMVGPESANAAIGASAYGDANQSGLTGHYFLLPVGTELPAGLDVVADGVDVRPDSVHKPTHYTIFPSQRTTADQFVAAFAKLPRQYAGKKT